MNASRNSASVNRRAKNVSSREECMLAHLPLRSPQAARAACRQRCPRAPQLIHERAHGREPAVPLENDGQRTRAPFAERLEQVINGIGNVMQMVIEQAGDGRLSGSGRTVDPHAAANVYDGDLLQRKAYEVRQWLVPAVDGIG